jgi:hypothetical protein
MTKTYIENIKELDEYIKNHPNEVMDSNKISFNNANLEGIDFEDKYYEIDLDNMDFYNTNLKNAVFSNITIDGADFTDANLEGANFSRSELNNISFDGSNLTKINIFKTNFSRIFLNNAKGLITAQLGKNLAVFQPSTRRLNIGCHSHNLDFWFENYKIIGEENEYTNKDIEIYHEFMKFCDSI